jgi:hypothetical protein
MKAKQTQVQKRTFSAAQLPILLLQESFKRDLSLFSRYLQEKEGFFGKPIFEKDWTFTVVTSEDGNRELVVNVPPKK